MLRSTSPANARTVSKSSSLLAAIVLSTLTLAACGGGGGGGSSPPPASPSNPPPPPPPPPPANTAPTASAGADQTIQLPTNSVTLAGSATDPDTANTITYAWTSTPADGVTFANAAAAATTATFAAAGTYTLTLTANDGTASGTDALVVTVNAAAPPPGPTLSWPGPDDNVDPNHGWVAAANPAEVGMDSARLIEAETVALKGGGSGFVARYGKIAHKWGDIDARVDVKSATKSIGGIALALAIDDGKVKLEDKAQLHLPAIGVDPDLAGTPNDATALSSITLLNLATHTAGFEKIRWSNAKILPDLLPVGSTFSYSDGGLNWLADALTSAYQQDLKALLQTRVWTPIGIAPVDLLWRDIPGEPSVEARPAVPNNIQKQRELAGGITTNPNAMGRIGLLYLRKGKWKDTQLISESSVELAMKPRPEIAGAKVANENDFPFANLNYGLLWWTNANKQIPEVPADAFWAWGLADSLIVVIPSLDLVITRVDGSPDSTTTPHWRSETNGYPKWNGNYEILKPFLIPIVQSVTPTP